MPLNGADRVEEAWGQPRKSGPLGLLSPMFFRALPTGNTGMQMQRECSGSQNVRVGRT